MSVAATTGPGPGWYPDPHAAAQLRWWNGAGWTESTTPVPQTAPVAPEPQPVREAEPAWEPALPAFVASTSEPIIAPELPRIERFQSSFVRDATSFVLDLPPEEDLGPAGPPPVRFSFRARAAVPQDELESVLMYVPPTPVPEPVIEPEPVPDPEPERVVEPDPVPDAEVIEDADDDEDFEIVDAELVDEADDAPRAGAPRRTLRLPDLRSPGRKTALVVVAAAGAAGLTNLFKGGDSAPNARHTPAVAVSAVAKDCLKLWNTADSASSAQQRITLGQFAGAYARVGRVQPLAGTLMEPNSCGLTVYDPGTDTSAVFVAGVKDQVGYLDVTAYPRAAKQYGAPKTAAQANATITADGTLIAKS